MQAGSNPNDFEWLGDSSVDPAQFTAAFDAVAASMNEADFWNRVQNTARQLAKDEIYEGPLERSEG